MILIASSTDFSIEKTAQLLRNLVNIRNRNVDLPEEISTGVNNLLKAQEAFMKDIDHYLHESSINLDEDHIESITTIVETCPEFLATKDEHGRLPCHIAALVGSSSANK